MRPNIFGVIGPGFLYQVPTLESSIPFRLQETLVAQFISTKKCTLSAL